MAIEISDIKATKDWMLQDCNTWFDQLAEALKDTHVVVGSCNKDCSRYLVPIGTEDQITYYGKPANSFRVSDHWNWRSPLKKCKKEKYVQCYSKDMPWTAKRMAPGKASRPMIGNAVMYYSGVDKAYHVMYGEKFDRETKTWSFVTMDVARGVDIATKPPLEALHHPDQYAVPYNSNKIREPGTHYISDYMKGANENVANS